MDFSHEEIESMLNGSDFDADRKQLKTELISTGFLPEIAEMVARYDNERLEEFARRIKIGNDPALDNKDSRELQFKNWEALEIVKLIEKILGKEIQ